MCAQLRESQLEVRSALTSSVFCVGSNLPAGNSSQEGEGASANQREISVRVKCAKMPELKQTKY